MFKKFYTFLNNMKVRNKLIVIFGVMGIIPMLVIMVVSSYIMSDILRDKEEQILRTRLKQVAYSVEAELVTYNSLSSYISFNEIMANVFAAEYDDSNELIKRITNIIKPQLETVAYFGDSVKKTILYVDCIEDAVEEKIIPLAEVENEYWYKSVCKDEKNHWYVDREENIAFCVRKSAVLRKKNIQGLFYLSIDCDELFEGLTYNMGTNYGIFVVDSNDNLVYEITKFEEKYSKYNLKYEEFQALNKDAEYEVVYERIQNTDWKLCLYKPHATIVSDTRPIRLLIIFVIMVSVITLFIGMVWIGRVITDRLLYLKRGMIAAEEGDFSFRLEDNSKDEIGELIRGYNTLLTKMEILIKEVYESEIAQKKYEMKALQNQINPHFLYNTLSLINWKAIENGNKDISEITLALSHFYRTSLNKGRNVLPIADEIKNVKSYIAVQLFMHDYDFDVEYQIDESIMKYESLNLILQPIVENAIEHGLDVMEGDVRGKIFIKGWLENNKIYLSVEDNGVGMNEEKTKNIITQKSNGYGMCNVNERIHLYYGEEYGIKVESKINKGTIVTICIPADCTLCLEK